MVATVQVRLWAADPDAVGLKPLNAREWKVLERDSASKRMRECFQVMQVGCRDAVEPCSNGESRCRATFPLEPCSGGLTQIASTTTEES